MLKMLPEMSALMKINLFHSHLRKDLLHTFRNINASNKRTLEGVLIIFRRKYARAQSQPTAECKWHTLTFDRNRKSLSDLFEELIECSERAFGPLAQQMIENLLYAKLPPTPQTVQ